MVANPNVIVSEPYFDSGNMYDRTQCDETIKDGDVLVVDYSGEFRETDQVVGFLLEAWPVAITEHFGKFHTFGDDADPSKMSVTGSQTGETKDYTNSVKRAVEEATKRGWAVQSRFKS